MKTEAYFQAKNLWDSLSSDDRTEILHKYNFWQGFNTYLWEYIPEDLKTVMMLKIDINEQFNENTTMIF
jgi:hypothetical protein